MSVAHRRTASYRGSGRQLGGGSRAGMDHGGHSRGMTTDGSE